MEQRAPSAAPEALKMFIDGRWVASEDGETFDAVNPATGEVIATLPRGTRADAGRAVDSANRNKHKLAGMTAWERSRLCLAIADAIEARADELARTLTADQGKPLATEAPFEVNMAINGFREAAEHIKWLETAVIPVEDPHKRVFSIRQPRGVYAVVTPWNFPYMIPVEYLAPAIASGNAVVWVPAPTTSVCAVRLMECLEAAGVPEGVVHLVTGPGDVVGDEIVAHPGTDAVGFTGSAATGTRIAQRAAGKPLLLELGGNGPVVILDDADLELAAQATSVGCFLNAGQVCSSSERVLVHGKVHDEMAERMVASAKGVTLGNPAQAGISMGPLNNPAVAAKVRAHVADGAQRGAQVLYGGNARAELGSELFFEPTVLTNVALDSQLNLEETFGPVVPLVRVDSDEELIAIANRNSLGLVSSVFTRDLKRAFRFAETLRTGITTINDTSNYWELHIPFGGVAGKRSGIGRLGGKHTIQEMTDLRTVCIDLR